MINIGIIGLGTIFTTQLKVLRKMRNQYRIVAVCDNDECVIKRAKKLFATSDGEVPYIYYNSEELFQNPLIDAVLIATPPHTHYELTCQGILWGKSVLLEKPETMDYFDLEDLYEKADRAEVMLHVAYHAAYAKDLVWFLKYGKRYAIGEISELTCHFYDPYVNQERMQDGKDLLGGCYIDSGVNALSVCNRLVDLDDYHLQQKEEKFLKMWPEIPYEAYHTFESNRCRIVLNTNWNKGLSHKSTLLSYINSNRKILLDHTAQSVYLIEGNTKELLYAYEGQERLEVQYEGVFEDFYLALEQKKSNCVATLKIHKLVLLEEGK